MEKQWKRSFNSRKRFTYDGHTRKVMSQSRLWFRESIISDNGSHYLRYEEMLDEQGDPTVNYIKISSRGMEVRKKRVNNTYGFRAGKA